MKDTSHTGALAGLAARIWPLLLLSFLEGGALMAVELLGAKLVAPYYGNSIYVWSAVLGTTLGGLALGYFLGGQLAGGVQPLRWLRVALAGSAAYTALLPLLSGLILEASLGVAAMQAGIILSCLLILTPPLLLFGMVSPLVIRLAAPNAADSGAATGIVYAVSTLGGILFTFTFAFWLMPFVGLRISCWVTSAILLLAFSFSLSEKVRSLGR